jgi:hypothetical protein
LIFWLEHQHFQALLQILLVSHLDIAIAIALALELQYCNTITVTINSNTNTQVLYNVHTDIVPVAIVVVTVL